MYFCALKNLGGAGNAEDTVIQSRSNHLVSQSLTAYQTRVSLLVSGWLFCRCRKDGHLFNTNVID